jgi:hypothetical protein
VATYLSLCQTNSAFNIGYPVATAPALDPVQGLIPARSRSYQRGPYHPMAGLNRRSVTHGGGESGVPAARHERALRRGGWGRPARRARRQQRREHQGGHQDADRGSPGVTCRWQRSTVIIAGAGGPLLLTLPHRQPVVSMPTHLRITHYPKPHAEKGSSMEPRTPRLHGQQHPRVLVATPPSLVVEVDGAPYYVMCWPRRDNSPTSEPLRPGH